MQVSLFLTLFACKLDNRINCHEDAKCTEVAGSFTCACETFYTGNCTICTCELKASGSASTVTDKGLRVEDLR